MTGIRRKGLDDYDTPPLELLEFDRYNNILHSHWRDKIT